MNRIFRIAFLSLGCLATIGSGARAQKDVWTSPILITLVAEVSVDDSVVTLDQIAKITGSTLDMRQRIAKLDIADFKLFAKCLTITDDQVRFRLLLSGLHATQFRLAGVHRVNVRESDDPISVRKIRACAESALLQKYPGDASKITIRLKQEFTIPLIYARPNDRVQYEGRAGLPLPTSGKSRVDVAIIVNGRTREVVPVILDVTAPDAPVVNVNNVMKPGPAPIRPAEFVPAKQEPILVRTNDLVKMVAYIGKIRIETVGEAMQEGKLHETIRIRNLDSSRIVPGRVSAPGIVEVDY
jgi:hypothetical protein